ncbi:MAG: response regulator transcription factor [Chakrabartia sp.]
MRILLIEDDQEIASRFVVRLSESGFVVEHAHDAEAALAWPDPNRFSALIVDLGLPGMDGISLVKQWRNRKLTTPILILSARGSWQEKVDGLNAGADDYVVKPIRAEEIAARLHALTRRAAGQTSHKLSAGKIELDPAAKAVWLEGVQINLSQMEYRLLHLLLLRAGHILAQGDILDHLYSMTSERDLNTVEVHIGRLRRKIGRDAITTVRGLGYRLER